jgi:hypothetical protein
MSRNALTGSLALAGALALASALTLAGCATPPAAAQGDGDAAAARGTEDAETDRRNACIYVNRLDSYHVIDDRNIVVESRGDRFHLVTTFACPQLDAGATWRIGIDTRGFTTLCGGGAGADVVVFDTAGRRFGPNRCPIRDIVPVDSVDAARDLVRGPAEPEDAE